jgi:hypothetical protein
MAFGIWDGTKVIAQFTAPLTVRSNVPVFASDTLSLKRHLVKRSAQRWEVEAGLEPQSTGSHELMSLLVTKGVTEEFKIIMPQNYGSTKELTTTANITATGSLGSSSVTISLNNGILPMGRFIKFNNHSKIYMTTSKLTSGSGVVGIFPELRVAVSNEYVYYKEDVQMSSLFDLDTITGMVYSDGILQDIGSIKIIERL